MNRDNQPVFNTDRKVVNFKNFSKDVEKEKLGKIRRSFQPNSDRQNFPSNDRNEFDPITRKVTQVTLPEVNDKIDAIEQDEEKNENVISENAKIEKGDKVVYKGNEYTYKGEDTKDTGGLKDVKHKLIAHKRGVDDVMLDTLKGVKKLMDKNENKSFESNLDIPLKLRLAYQKWIESEQPDYFGGDRDQELRMKAFMKELNEYSSSETRSKFIKALDSQYGEIPKRFKSHFLR